MNATFNKTLAGVIAGSLPSLSPLRFRPRPLSPETCLVVRGNPHPPAMCRESRAQEDAGEPRAT